MAPGAERHVQVWNQNDLHAGGNGFFNGLLRDDDRAISETREVAVQRVGLIFIAVGKFIDQNGNGHIRLIAGDERAIAFEELVALGAAGVGACAGGAMNADADPFNAASQFIKLLGDDGRLGSGLAPLAAIAACRGPWPCAQSAQKPALIGQSPKSV